MAARPGNNEPPPIIVKKVIVQASDGHHGGAWKVAYADFVTAMMAFFLLLWLLGSTDEAQRKGLADYFTPTLVKLKEQSAGSDGLMGGASITDPDNYPHRASQTGTQALTIPRDASGGAREGASQINRMRERLEQRVAANERLRKLMRQVRMVDTTTGVLTIRASKRKDRLVPVHPTTLDALEAYRRLPARQATRPVSDAPLPVSSRGTGYHRSTIELYFARVVTAAGLCPRGAARPRLHDLRHTFATGHMAAAYAGDGDPHRVLDADAEAAGQINAGFDRDDVPRLGNLVVTPRQVGGLVDF